VLVAILAALPVDAQGVTPLPLAGAEDATGEGLAFVELTADAPAPFVRQEVLLHLRVGLARELVDGQLLQLFRRALDVPIQVQAPWERGLADARFDAVPGAESGGPVIALGTQPLAVQSAWDVERDGRAYRVLEIEERCLFSAAGAAVLPAPLVRFAYATRFEDGLIDGRRPLDRRDVLVRGQPLAIEVRPLPEEGRPPGFTGAVGSFTVAARAEPPALALGESLRLTLEIRGDGDLEGFAAPRPELPGFHVEGVLDRHGAGERTITWDVAPTDAGAHAVPPLELATFDPSPPAGYRVLRTQPIPIEVLPPAGPPAGPPAARGVRDAAPARRLAPLAVAVPLLALLLLALVLVLRRRRRARTAPAAAADLVRTAAARFRVRLDEPGADPAAALVAFLAALLGCPEPAVVAPDLERRLAARGMPPELAARAAAALEHLHGARFGGSAGDPAAAERARGLVDELERAS